MRLSLQSWPIPLNWQRMGRHLLFWLADLFLVPLQAYLYGLTAEYNLIVAAQWIPCNMVITYSFLYRVLPWLLSGNLIKFWVGSFVGFLGWCGGIYLYRDYIILPLNTSQPLFIDNSGGNRYWMVTIMIQGSVLGIAASLKLWRHWSYKEQINQQLTQEATLAELQLLKAQIHPHFLFNTLNNLYSLTLKQSGNAPNIVLRLSEVLHYMLHECNVPDVPIQKEIQIIKGYIELEKLRYGKRLLITVTVEGNLSGKNIPPLLLIPFVENAFKHGSAEQTDQAYIHIHLQVMDETLLFNVTNSKNEGLLQQKKHSGIGLVNVRKRLALIFPHQYELTIRPDTNRYDISLMIPVRNLKPTEKNLYSVIN